MPKENSIIPSCSIKNINLRKRILKDICDFAPRASPLINEMLIVSDMTHAANVTTAYLNFITNLLTVPNTNISDKDTAYLINQGIINALFHDIGKLGVVPSGIDDSYKIFHFEENNSKNNKPSLTQIDNRSREIQAIQHLHPLIGGFMLELYGLNAKTTAFSHHESFFDNDVMVVKSSYPRMNGKRDVLPVQNFANTIISLIDSAVAMRERRYNRRELDFSIIEKEFNLQINGEIIKRLKPFLPKFLETNEELKKYLIEKLLSSTRAIDPEIRIPFNKPIINPSKLTYAEQIHLAPNLSLLIEKTWKLYEKRIIDTYNKYLENGFFHNCRN